MAGRFVGRASELALLRKRLDSVAQSRTGTALAIRGRRQVGKSRLTQEFCDAAGVPYVFFTATKGLSPVEAIGAFLREVRESGLPSDPGALPENAPGSWLDALRVLAAALPDTPSIVVFDELPWLAEQDEAFDGALQTAWDRLLSRHPVLLVMLGSDIHMMERLTAYDRPFYGRADNLVLGPLNPAETGQAVGLDAADAVDAYLISGGLPGILRSWPVGMSPLPFVEQECADPAAPLFSVPEATLLAEFPLPDQARRVLEAVGSGDRTYGAIAAAAGGGKGPLASGALSPLLQQLVREKHVVAVDQPLSTRPGKPNLYRIADSNLRLYLAALRSSQELVRRGRPEAAFQMFARRWETWRGRAVEPLVRDSLELAGASGALPWPEVETVGGWWNRQFNPEVDLVGADRYPVARRLWFAGSIKWLKSPFDRHDLAVLHRRAPQVPGFEPDRTGLVIVSMNGVDSHIERDSADVVWNAADVISAYI
ncbi:ATP-binding protein [Phytoactinopolyspora mesophila]|uniref:AAA family ATPase n=1 Tax=Phytoactinopolyspora mesophila TaxID=2650750 RepID=A0A7K3M6P3_9ACTN|nr:ATP-binding protein [Phytoactinopolyspora mesophila]NDL58979.1 AAA family ATPase [Phytoactinopolyspora mesophila]